MAGIIDPELLAAHEDPSLRFLAQLNTADPSPPLEGSDSTDFDDEDLMDPSDLSGIKDVSALMKIINIGRSSPTKQTQNWTHMPRCMTLPEERAALLFAEVVEIVDIIKQKAQQRVEEWKVSENLKKSITTFAKGIILSPTITMYRGNGPAEKVLHAMQTLGIRDMPHPDDLSNMQKVLTEIRHQLTIARNLVKTRICDSIEEDSATRNIGDLAMALTAGTPIQPTVQLLVRLAFLRWHAVSYASLDETQWWPRVDDTLKTWRSTCPTELLLTKAFNKMFDDNKLTYGNPTESELQMVNIRDLPNIQSAIDREASKLDTSRSGGAKRRRVN
ncbi:hypothetical protein EYR40_002511 [Pleurotus pulmonarius]|nr:hypothetical protein EYR40_002511 [Pleurotus pulmonarius]